jgi:hypothetical protein
MSNGALYIITQDPRYVAMMLISAASLKRAMPDLPITAISQFPVDSPLFEKVMHVEGSRDGFYDKCKLIRESPYERTMFIDADCYVLEPVPELFSLLDQFDAAATHEEYVDTDWHKRYPRPDVPVSFPEFNTGVLLFKRSDAMNRVLDQWERLFRKYLQDHPGQMVGDQLFFRVATYYGDARIATLTREYNCKYRGQGYLNGKVKIAHGHVDFKLDPDFMNRAAAVLNATRKPRVYVAGEVYEQRLVGRFADLRKAGRVGSFPLQPDLPLVAEAKRLKKIVKQRGMRNIVTRVLDRK